MTKLRPEDADLHDGSGEHLEPDGHHMVGRMRRHLAAHDRDAGRAGLLRAVEETGAEHGAAYEALRDAQGALTAKRGRLVLALRAAAARGVSVAELARRSMLNPRTVRDYLEYGQTRPRG